MSDPAYEHHSDPLPLLGTLTERTGSRGIDQELLRTVLVHLPVAVSVLDAEQRFILVNQRAVEINGLPADAHVDRLVFDLLPGIPRSIGTVVRPVIETGEPEANVDIVGSTPARPDSPRWRGKLLSRLGRNPTLADWNGRPASHPDKNQQRSRSAPQDPGRSGTARHRAVRDPPTCAGVRSGREHRRRLRAAIRSGAVRPKGSGSTAELQTLGGGVAAPSEDRGPRDRRQGQRR